MKSKFLHQLRVPIATFVEAMEIILPIVARIPIILVVSVSLDNSLISPIISTTVSATIFSSQPVVVMNCGTICSISIYPGIILHQIII